MMNPCLKVSFYLGKVVLKLKELKFFFCLRTFNKKGLFYAKFFVFEEFFLASFFVVASSLSILCLKSRFACRRLELHLHPLSIVSSWDTRHTKRSLLLQKISQPILKWDERAYYMFFILRRAYYIVPNFCNCKSDKSIQIQTKIGRSEWK